MKLSIKDNFEVTKIENHFSEQDESVVSADIERLSGMTKAIHESVLAYMPTEFTASAGEFFESDIDWQGAIVDLFEVVSEMRARREHAISIYCEMNSNLEGEE